MRSELSLLSLLLTITLLWTTSPDTYAEIVVTHPEIRETTDHYMVNAEFSYTMGKSVVDALKNGIPLIFVAEYIVEEVAPFWATNPVIQQREHSFVLSYREFTNRYYLISLDNNSHGAYGTIEEALNKMMVRHDAMIIDKSLLSDDKSYLVKMRSSIDSKALPGLIRPYVYTPYLWPEWKLDSGWHTIKIEQ